MNSELGRSPGERNGKPLQYSCLENPLDRRAWWATVCSRVAKCQTRPSYQHFHFHHKGGDLWIDLALDFDRLRWVWEEGVLSRGTAPAEERWKVMCTDEELCI